MPTEAETALLELATQFVDGENYRLKKQLADAARAVVLERVPEDAKAAWIEAEIIMYRAGAVGRAAQAKLGLPEFLTRELRETARKKFAAEEAAKYVHTGVAATEEEEAAIKEAYDAPIMIIGNYAPIGGPEVVHALALKYGLPEIVGHYGYDFKSRDFVHLAGATEGEPDRWPSRKLSDVLAAVGLTKGEVPSEAAQ